MGYFGKTIHFGKNCQILSFTLGPMPYNPITIFYGITRLITIKSKQNCCRVVLFRWKGLKNMHGGCDQI